MSSVVRHHGVRQSQRLGLGNIGDLNPPIRAIADSFPYVAPSLGGDDDADVGDARFPDLVENVEQDWLVRDAQELLGYCVGEGLEPGV